MGETPGQLAGEDACATLSTALHFARTAFKIRWLPHAKDRLALRLFVLF